MKIFTVQSKMTAEGPKASNVTLNASVEELQTIVFCIQKTPKVDNEVAMSLRHAIVETIQEVTK